MPTHQANDIILCFANKDGTGAMTENSGSGWQLLQSGSDGGAWSGVWWKRANSSSETAASFTFSVDTYNIVTVSIKGAHTTTDPGSYKSSVDSSMPFTQNQSITTSWDNSLILHGIGTDGGLGPTPYPGHSQVLYAGDAGANSMGVGWKFYPDASSDVDVEFFGRVNDTTQIFTIEIRDDGNNTEVQAYVPNSDLLFEYCLSNAALHGFTWQTSLSLSSIGGKTTAYDLISSGTDTGVNPYHTSARFTPAQSATNLGGTEVLSSSPKNWASGYLLATFLFTTPRDFIDLGLFMHKGFNVTLLDTGNDYKSFIVGAKDTVTTYSDRRNIFAIQPAQSVNTSWASSGTFNPDAIDTLMFLMASVYGAVSLNVSYLLLSGIVTLAGGSSAFPIDFTKMVDGFNNGSSLFPILYREGSAATIWNPIKIGGAGPINIQINLRTFQFPVTYDEPSKVCNFHVDKDLVGIEFDGQVGDVISFKNCVFTSDSRYYWKISSTAVIGATWDFSGTSIAGALVTLRNVMTFDSMSFINCTIDVSNCAMTDCSFTEPPNNNNSLTTNANTTFDECSFGIKTLSAGNYLCSVANPTIFEDCDFVGSSSNGHAIRITTPGTYTFVGNAFTGFGANGTTSAAIYNDSGGLVTLNISDGGSTPTYRNGSGATTVINNSVSVKITVKDAVTKTVIQGARVFLKTTPGEVTVFNSLTDVNGKVETTYNYTTDENVTGRVRASSSTPYYKTSDITGQITSTGFETTILMIKDE